MRGRHRDSVTHCVRQYSVSRSFVTFVSRGAPRSSELRAEQCDAVIIEICEFSTYQALSPYFGKVGPKFLLVSYSL